MPTGKPSDPKTSTTTLPEGEGESAGRRRGIEEHGGKPLTTPLEDGQVREKREGGAPPPRGEPRKS